MAAATGALLAAPLAAQALPQPGSVVAPPTREEINRIPLTTGPTPPSRLTVSGDIERAPCPLDEPRFGGVTVTLKEVVFDDLKGVDPADLRDAYASYLGRSVPIGAVCEIRDAAATILRRDGFLAAVQVPPQTIAGGVVHLKVLMARLVAIHVRGETGHSEKLIAAYLERLKTGQPFNQRDAERWLMLARDLPGYDIRLVLHPAGTIPGDVVGDVTVTRTPVNIDANVQNYGSHAEGRWSGLVRAEFNDLIGLGDRAVIGVDNTFDTREQTVVQGAYEVRPGSDGLTLAGHFTYAWTRPDIGGGDPLRARSLVATAEASYPVIRRQAETVRLVGGFDAIDQKLRFDGIPLTNDHLRVLYARADFDLLDQRSIASVKGYSAAEPRWHVAGSIEFRHGIDALGASNGCGAGPLYARCAAPPSLSRLDGDPTGGLVRATVAVEMRPRPDFTIAVSPRLQYAFDPLLSYEQYSAGNYTIGRGYDPGALIGDDGAGVQAELRLGKITPKGPDKFAIQPFAFVDAAWTWTRGPLKPFDNPEHLYSAGGGVRAAFGDLARLDATLAVPLSTPPLQDRRGDVRFLVSLTTRLLPWRRM